jgi:hypothetical protein
MPQPALDLTLALVADDLFGLGNIVDTLHGVLNLVFRVQLSPLAESASIDLQSELTNLLCDDDVRSIYCILKFDGQHEYGIRLWKAGDNLSTYKLDFETLYHSAYLKYREDSDGPVPLIIGEDAHALCDRYTRFSNWKAACTIRRFHSSQPAL